MHEQTAGRGSTAVTAAEAVAAHAALELVAKSLATNDCSLIEMGAHPVLTPVAADTLKARGVSVVGSAASMRRQQPVLCAADAPVG